jgi:hypothetical protein
MPLYCSVLAQGVTEAQEEALGVPEVMLALLLLELGVLLVVQEQLGAVLEIGLLMLQVQIVQLEAVGAVGQLVMADQGQMLQDPAEVELLEVAVVAVEALVLLVTQGVLDMALPL